MTMAVSINDAVAGPLVPALGVSVISMDFWLEDEDWLKVYRNDTLLTIVDDYTVSGVGTSSPSVTLVTAANGTDVYSVWLDTPLERTSDLSFRADFRSETMNYELDRVWQRLQLHDTEIKRRAGLSLSSTSTTAPTLPAPDPGLVLGWASGGVLENKTMIDGVTAPGGAAYNFLAWDAAASAISNTRTAVTATSMATLVAILNAGHVARLDPSQTYTFAAAITIPDGAVIVGSAPITYTGSETIVYLTIGDDVAWEDLDLTAPGVGAHADAHIKIGSGYRGRRIRARATTGTTTGNLIWADADFRVDEFDTEGFARPIVLCDITGAEAEQDGGYIGRFRVRDHIRAFKSINRNDWIVCNVDIADTSASTTLGEPGYNAFLIDGGNRWAILGGRVQGSSEHAIRIAGAGCEQWRIHGVLFEDTYESCIKINGSAIAAEGLITDCMAMETRTASPGGNADVFRFSHCRDITVDGFRVILKSGGTYTFDNLVSLNDAVGVTVRNVDAEGLRQRLFNYNGDQDATVEMPGAPVSDVILENIVCDLTASVAGYAFAVQSTTAGETLGNVTWIGGEVRMPTGMGIASLGGTGGLAASTTRSVRGVRFISPDANPNFNGWASSDWTCDIEVNGVGYFGQNGNASFNGRGRLIVGGTNFSANDVSTNAAGLLINAPTATGGTGAAGPALVFSRVGSSRRGAAIVATQVGASEENMRLDFYAGSNITATDALIQVATLNYLGVLNIARSTGEIRINDVKVVDSQQSAIANDASGAANQATVNAILTALRNHGLIAT